MTIKWKRRLRWRQRGAGPSACKNHKAGIALVEVAVAIVVMVGALLGYSQAILSSAKSTRSEQDLTLAAQAARQMLEQLTAEDFRAVFARYNDDPSDDPGGPGTAPGSGFAIVGLDASSDDADGLPGEIVFPTLPGAPGVLREDFTRTSWGMPRDLSGDGVADTADHATDYELLPVEVRVQWAGASKADKLSFVTLLGGF